MAVNSNLSLYPEVISGIPQGSVLGPILFVIFISTIWLYQMGSVELEATPVQNDLRMFVDNVPVTSRLLVLIRTTFACIDEDTLPQLFTILVRSHMDYRNSLWHHRHRIAKLQIKKIQRRTTKLIPFLKHLSYEERLHALKRPSLHFRRRRGDMLKVFKIMNRLDWFDTGLFFLRAEGRCTRGHKTSYLCVTVGLKSVRTCSAKE
jgi:hypothetical protein